LGEKENKVLHSGDRLHDTHTHTPKTQLKRRGPENGYNKETPVWVGIMKKTEETASRRSARVQATLSTKAAQVQTENPERKERSTVTSKPKQSHQAVQTSKLHVSKDTQVTLPLVQKVDKTTSTKEEKALQATSLMSSFGSQASATLAAKTLKQKTKDAVASVSKKLGTGRIKKTIAKREPKLVPRKAAQSSLGVAH
jgi:hypothetical protein